MNVYGGVIFMECKIQVFGKVFLCEGVNMFINWFNENELGDFFFISVLGVDVLVFKVVLGDICGVLVVCFYCEQDGYVFWFCIEQVEDVCWGGNLEKKYSIGLFGLCLILCGFFVVWKEMVCGKSLLWVKIEIEIVNQL